MQLLAAGLGLVRALLLQAREVARRDVARDVAAGEAGIVELLDVWCRWSNRPNGTIRWPRG
jgi:hypothetical protein